MTSVLHLSGDFAKQRIYTLLVSNLRLRGVTQAVYAPVRTAEEATWSASELDGIPVYLRFILRRRHRILFRTKIRRITNDLRRTVDLSAIDVVHAHFLYSDGAVALRLKREAGIPYIVAVRNADMNAFMRLRPDLAGIRNDVLREAARVVFLSPAYKRALLQRVPADLRPDVERRALVIPNGIGLEWLESHAEGIGNAMEGVRVLYVGDFTTNKNLPNVIRAIAIARHTRPVSLTLVGGGGDGAAEVSRLMGEHSFVTNLGRIDDPQRLRQVYRAHDIFVMPSFTETFGVVYIEALSQGLPIIYSHGQGVDGYFTSGTVAEGVDPNDPAGIARAVLEVAGRVPGIQGACIDEARKFEWTGIARAYQEIYEAVVAERATAITDTPRRS